MTWGFWALVGLLLVYEAVALARHRGETISEIIWRLGRRPLVPFVLGMLAGHLVWCW